MEKFFPPGMQPGAEQPAPINPAVVIHDLLEQVRFLQGSVAQHQNISIILAAELFRHAKVITENAVVAQGHRALNVTGPLAWVIPQARINAIEGLFGEDPATLQFMQENVGAEAHLVMRLIPLSEAEKAFKNAMN